MILHEADAREHFRAYAPLFRAEEFACHCANGELVIETEFAARLYRLRVEFARPMLITSGYRCPDHNARVSATGLRGPHTTGRAADVGIFGPDAFDLVALAIAHGFRGIGVRQVGAWGRRFIHVDDLPGDAKNPRPRVWSYA